MRAFLMTIFGLILISMVAMTALASMDRGVFQAASELWPDLWFKATLMDAYFGFLTFYIWVAYKERRIVSRILWFVLIMCFGNIAMSVYVLIQLYRTGPGESWKTLLIKRPA